MTRTRDLLITSEMLYQLSYTSLQIVRRFCGKMLCRRLSAAMRLPSARPLRRVYQLSYTSLQIVRPFYNKMLCRRLSADARLPSARPLRRVYQLSYTSEICKHFVKLRIIYYHRNAPLSITSRYT